MQVPGFLGHLVEPKISRGKNACSNNCANEAVYVNNETLFLKV